MTNRGNDGGNEQPNTNPGDGNNGQDQIPVITTTDPAMNSPIRTPVATTMNNRPNPGMITTTESGDDNNQPNPGDGSSEGDVVIKIVNVNPGSNLNMRTARPPARPSSQGLHRARNVVHYEKDGGPMSRPTDAPVM